MNAIYNNQTLSEEENERYEALYQVCEISVNNPVETECNIVKTLREVSSDFALKSEVKVASIRMDFLEDFREFVTVNGICYTSNLLHAKDLFKTTIAPNLRFPKNVSRSNWTSYGYDNFNPLAYPQRVIGSGQEAGFKIILKMKKTDIDFTCKSTANSFRLTIHAPNELPQTNSHYYKIPLNVETLIAIEPRVVTTSDELKHYKPKKRQCYFPGEERLTFFKAYTQANCKLECFAGDLIKSCFRVILLMF